MMALFKPLFRQSFATSGIYLLIVALSLAISATTALTFSHDQIKKAVSLQAAKMQAADLVLTDHAPIESLWKEQAQSQHLQQSEVTVFSSMAHTQDQFVMVNVKAVEDNFPLRGELKIKPSSPLKQGNVWLSQRAMDLLKVRVGDAIGIADGQFRVAGVIQHDSNQELGFSAFSPTVIISQRDIAMTHAIQVGSRIDYRLLLSGEPQQLKNFEQFFKKKNPSLKAQQDQEGLKLRKANDGNTRLMKPIRNLDTFLQLANILTILLCGIAIALTSQRYVQQNQDYIALMRCMGANKGHILKAYAVLLLVIIALSMSLGSLLGLALGYGLLQLMLQLIPNLELNFAMVDMLFGPLPIAIFTSAIVLFGFVLPSLWQLLKTPPIRVIREQEKSTRSMLVMFLTGILSLIVFSLVLTSNVKLTLIVVGSIIALSIVLYIVVWSILKSIKAFKNKFSSYVRSPSQTALQVTALALGLSLISVLTVLKTDLFERWQQQLPKGTPNQFVYGLPPFEVQQFEQQLKNKHWNSTPLYPNIKGRLIQRNGHTFTQAQIQKNNALRRELNLTQTAHYPEDNIIVSGSSALKKAGEVSVEANLAQALGIQLGDALTFSLPEGEITAKVVNLRQVEWESFNPNFFFIFAPNTMDANAGSYLGSFYVPPAEKHELVGLIQQFSNTVFIDVTLILEEVRNLVNVLVQIITVLSILVSISGFLVLVACINLLMDERKKEVALLRSFGASKQQLKSMMTIEIGLIGLMSGIISCLFAEVISAVVSSRMNLNLQIHVEIWFILPIIMMLLCALIGRYRLSYLSEIPPLQSLKEMNA